MSPDDYCLQLKHVAYTRSKNKKVCKECLCDDLPYDLQVNTNRMQSDIKVKSQVITILHRKM